MKYFFLFAVIAEKAKKETGRGEHEWVRMLELVGLIERLESLFQTEGSTQLCHIVRWTCKDPRRIKFNLKWCENIHGSQPTSTCHLRHDSCSTNVKLFALNVNKPVFFFLSSHFRLQTKFSVLLVFWPMNNRWILEHREQHHACQWQFLRQPNPETNCDVNAPESIKRAAQRTADKLVLIGLQKLLFRFGLLLEAIQ